MSAVVFARLPTASRSAWSPNQTQALKDPQPFFFQRLLEEEKRFLEVKATFRGNESYDHKGEDNWNECDCDDDGEEEEHNEVKQRFDATDRDR